MSQPTTPRTRKAPAAGRKPSGKVRTGNPVEDRALRAAAAEKAASKLSGVNTGPTLGSIQRSDAAKKAAATRAAKKAAAKTETTVEEFQRLMALPLTEQAQPAIKRRIQRLANLPENTMAGQKATPAKKAAAKATPAKVTVPKGYTIRWTKPSFLLAKPDEKGASWLVICTAHGTTTEALTARIGDGMGAKAVRATWCKKCQG